MMDTPVSTAWLAAGIAATLFNIIFPLVLTWVVVRRLSQRWRWVAYGALVFFVSQIVLRLPLVTVAQLALGPVLEQSRPMLWLWLLVLSLTAGLFEETGRYIGYRWLMRNERKTWAHGVVYGLGHGGFEAVLLTGVLGLVNVVVLSQLGSLSAALPTDQQQIVAQQLAAVAAQPWWTPLLGAWERIWALTFHVAMSLVVLQMFWRGQRRWLWIAIGAHGAFNFIAVGLLQLGVNLLVVEGVVALMGLMALWTIFRLRRPPVAPQPTSLPPPGVRV